MRGEVVQSRDPHAERTRERVKGVTLREAFEVFLKTRRKLKPNTVTSYRKYLQTVFADWLDRAFVGITREGIATRHAQVTEASGPAHADNAMRTLRAVLNFAIVQFEGPGGERLMVENPVARLSQTKAWNRVGRRKTLIAKDRLRPWFEAVLELKQTPPDSQDALVADYLLLLILTGLRRSEAAALTWDQVDLKARTFTLRDTQTKNRETHTLPLSDYLTALLARRRKMNGDGRYVFPGQSKSGHLMEPRPQMRRITARSGVAFVLHDLRRTFATVAESLDIPHYALKRLLNHKMADVTAGYLIITPERLREPMQRITDSFLSAAGMREGAKVVRLVSGRAS
jgi:integrase